MINPVKSNRWSVSRQVERDDQDAIHADILQGRDICGGFLLTGAPVPASLRTSFKVYICGDKLTAAILLDEQAGADGESVEIFFDPRHDHIGFFQFCFSPGKEAVCRQHLPYAAARASDFPRIELLEHQWDMSAGRRWLRAVFSAAEVFRYGGVCGFNVAGSSAELREASSWNLCAGNGFPDAGSFGHLYRDAAPVEWNLLEVSSARDGLRLSGRLSSGGAGAAMHILSPDGERLPLTAEFNKDSWQAFAGPGDFPPGRYLLRAESAAFAVEPEYFFFNLPGGLAEPILSMEFDVPDDLIHGAFSPGNLAEEMRRLKGYGMKRIYWIDYPTAGEYPSFWNIGPWSPHAEESFARCGDLLPLAADQAHRQGLDFTGVVKIFDMGFTGFKRNVEDIDGRDAGWVPHNGGTVVAAEAPVVAHPECVMQAHEDWLSKARLPLTQLTIYSEEPLLPLEAKDIRIWNSADNQGYMPYNGPMEVYQDEVSLPHYRWTPSGKEPCDGGRRNYRLQLRGLRIEEPYISLEIRRQGWRCRNLYYLLAEGLDAAGRAFDLLLSQIDGREGGFNFFNLPWPGWANHDEKLKEPYIWQGGELGIALHPIDHLPNMLEPAHPGSRRIWLDKVRRVLEAGADGVDIRILCHHNSTVSWLRHAFAPSVREAFLEKYGRETGATAEDCRHIRHIRGEALSRFLQQAKELTAEYKARLAVHFEPGIEMGSEFDSRMQIHLDWRKWIEEGLLDEITLKFWTPWSKFITEEVMPMARRHGVPLHICDNNSRFLSPRAMELAFALLKETAATGLAGFTLYENADYIRLNPAGTPEITTAVDALMEALPGFAASEKYNLRGG